MSDPNLDGGLSRAALKERRRFTKLFNQHLKKIESVSLSILVWGPNPSSSSLIAKKRIYIKDLLINLGHNAMFSEDLVTENQHKSLTIKTVEFAQAKHADVILSFIEDSPGALAEVHDFCNEPTLAPKFFIMVPLKYKNSYSSNGAISLLEKAYNSVYWYSDDELKECSVVSKALSRVQALREMMFSWKMHGLSVEYRYKR